MAYQDISSSIKKLASERNAVILSHYYQDSEVQDIADFVGDSLELSRFAASTSAEIIVFCGVYFMAEVAKILNPNKLVLVPDLNAGCSLADSCDAVGFAQFRKMHPNHVSITYINSSAEVKALSDVICTSSNAETIINNISNGKPILFAPDKYLGAYLQKKTNIDMVMWPGTCIVHESFSEKELLSMMSTLGEDVLVIAHPECPEILLNHAHFIGSTSQLINYVSNRNGQRFIVLTEEGILHKMRNSSPDSKFYIPGSFDSSCNACSKCPYMRLNTLEKIHECLVNKSNAIDLSPDLMQKAKVPIDKMMELSIGIGRSISN